MEKKSQDFSAEEALRLAHSPAARQLMEILRTKDPKQLDRAMTQAAAGDYRQAQQDLRSLLDDPVIQDLLKQLGGLDGGV